MSASAATSPPYARRTELIGGDGSDAWRVHSAAVTAQARGEDVIVMSIGDPDFATPDAITRTAISALNAGDTHYTGIAGRQPLREAIAKHHEQRTGRVTSADEVVTLAGAQCALYTALACLCDPGDEVIVPEPAYVTYPAAIGAQGARMVRTPARVDGSLRPDVNAIAAAMNPRTRAILFASPNNPTGISLNSDELAQIARLAQTHHCWVIQDEVYADLVFDGSAPSVSSLPGMTDRAISISSLSKSHAMTGWRVGWLIGPRALAHHAANLALCMLYGLPGFIQQAAITALGDASNEVADMTGIYRRRRDLVIDALHRGIGQQHCVVPTAGMFAMLDVRPTGLPSAEFSAQLFDHERVSVLDAGAFGHSSDGYVRVSFTSSDTQLAEGCKRIARFYRLRQAKTPRGIEPA